jgi:hypothetical protein
MLCIVVVVCRITVTVQDRKKGASTFYKVLQHQRGTGKETDRIVVVVVNQSKVQGCLKVVVFIGNVWCDGRIKSCGRVDTYTDSTVHQPAVIVKGMGTRKSQ